ncbi:hypothetical protein DFH08DRAFT_816059 [Mycena albidolilacea]|uniref:Uncharacterized protein n=1 Tax=Mycena albidolilacea TaxID=1033008 RepID=A0AAD6ZLB8_9AGAR|nr:hypothetical protein DFH08DRAFT_816059 [Mycena albidolilacea]
MHPSWWVRRNSVGLRKPPTFDFRRARSAYTYIRGLGFDSDTRATRLPIAIWLFSSEAASARLSPPSLFLLLLLPYFSLPVTSSSQSSLCSYRLADTPTSTTHCRLGFYESESGAEWNAKKGEECEQGLVEERQAETEYIS